jgi:hypothetical protein
MIKINVKGYIVPGISICFGLFSIYKIYDFLKKIINTHMSELVFIKCELYQIKNNNKLLEIRLTNAINSKITQQTNYIENKSISTDLSNVNEINEINENENENDMIIKEINNNALRLKDLEYDCITKHDICTPYKKNNSFNLSDIIKNIMF